MVTHDFALLWPPVLLGALAVEAGLSPLRAPKAFAVGLLMVLTTAAVFAGTKFLLTGMN